MLEGRKLINVESFLALMFSVFYCFLEMPLNADEYEAILQSIHQLKLLKEANKASGGDDIVISPSDAAKM